MSPLMVFETPDRGLGLWANKGPCGEGGEVASPPEAIGGSWEVIGCLPGACEQQLWTVTVISLPSTWAKKTALVSPGSGASVFQDRQDCCVVGELWGQVKLWGLCSEIKDLTGVTTEQ